MIGVKTLILEGATPNSAANVAKAADLIRVALDTEARDYLGEFLMAFGIGSLRNRLNQRIYVWNCVDKNGCKYSVLCDAQRLEALISASTQMLELDKREGVQ